MKISLFFVGKTSKKYIEEGIKEYEKRIKRYINFEIEIISDLKNAKNFPADLFKEKEGENILKRITESDFVVLLDENGEKLSSRQFAEFIENKSVTGIRKLIFIIGGAYGFSEQMYKRANYKLSLSPMTFSHQPVRILFAEQLYRAFTIIKGEPYHND